MAMSTINTMALSLTEKVNVACIRRRQCAVKIVRYYAHVR
ncbi:hypothetical protein DFP86_10713 [Paludibacterium purpuratum]|uniref:Uncharacterized protein n=1 Tax=Paludibacterium purpuratum TaxID=1144873 RepID=A0A4R7B4S8_9NEIS|nr:hypothetical protein DFP86_10713 [Paludibacterium purpuratum]